MHSEKYSLTWHTYSDHLKSMMKELMTNEDFADVTLVTEDKKQIKANISILRACSPVFKDILKKEKNSNTLMYLRGIQYSDMESIMQFIYLGEATFYEERMDEFLSVAKSLEIKELCNADTPTNDEPEDEPSPSDKGPSTEKFVEHTYNHVTEQASQEKEESVACFTRKYECEQCHKTFSSRSNLNNHKQSVHQGVKYACNQCDYQATKQNHLTVHIQSKHDGVRYACSQCDYQATTQNRLTVHIQSKHEGLKYACDQCDYQDSYRSNLARHIKKKHDC